MRKVLSDESCLRLPPFFAVRTTSHRRTTTLEWAITGLVDLYSAQALADVATIAVLQHRTMREAQLLNEQLHHAVSSRIVIEQAKGVVAERTGLTMEEAFSQLRTYARGHNVRLSDVALGCVNGTLAVDEFRQ